MTNRPASFTPLKRVTGPGGGVHLERPDGTTVEITSVVTDEADGITDADFDFDLGKDWAADTEDDDAE